MKLPDCALGQQANLIELFTMDIDGNDACSCLVITCDGYARFWRTIVRANEYFDVKLEFDQVEFLCHVKVKILQFDNDPFLYLNDTLGRYLCLWIVFRSIVHNSM